MSRKQLGCLQVSLVPLWELLCAHVAALQHIQRCWSHLEPRGVHLKHQLIIIISIGNRDMSAKTYPDPVIYYAFIVLISGVCKCESYKEEKEAQAFNWANQRHSLFRHLKLLIIVFSFNSGKDHTIYPCKGARVIPHAATYTITDRFDLVWTFGWGLVVDNWSNT